MSGAFTIYRFTEPTDPNVVFLENMTRDLYMEGPQQVARYATAFESVSAAALSPEQSASFLTSVLGRLA